MEILTISLAAGETKQFRKAGGYIEIIESSIPVSINFYSLLGGLNNRIVGGLSGLYLSADFGAFDVTNGAGAQTIKILICDAGEAGGSRRQPGSVRVIDEFTDALTCPAYSPSQAVAAFAVTPVIAPASNPNGLIVRWIAATAQSGAGGVASVGYVAAKTAPTSYSTPAQRYPLLGAYSSAQVLVDKAVQMNKLVPPGWGLYVYSEVTVAAAVTISGQIGYEVL